MAQEPITTHDPWTIGRLLTWTTRHFEGHAVDEPRLSAEILLAHALDCRRIELYTRFNDDPGDEIRSAFRELVRAAAAQTPIAYLVGHREFYSLDFNVTTDVLIPRPETETLVERALQILNNRPSGAGGGGEFTLLDMGTGSGCISVAFLVHATRARAVATDISQPALDVAAGNAERHGVAERIAFVQADRLQLPPGQVPPGGFNLILSNPPYVADSDLDSLPPNVRGHEPMRALSAGPDGLTYFKSLAAGGRGLLQPDGVVLVEIGAGQAEAVRDVFAAAGGYRPAGTYRSAGDSHDRVLHFTVL